MQEFVSEAVVLDKEPLGEADSRVSLYTEARGKVVAKAAASRNIVSRLAGHLEPGMISAVRVVGNGGGQIADAYAVGTLARTRETLRLLSFLGGFLMEGEADPALWDYLNKGTEETLDSRQLLAVLGFDPHGAACAHCGRSSPAYFNSREARFVCELCVAQTRIAGDFFRWYH